MTTFDAKGTDLWKRIAPRVLGRFGHLKILDREEILAEARLGMLLAINEFDQGRGASLLTYATSRAYWQVNRRLRSELGRDGDARKGAMLRKGSALALLETPAPAQGHPSPPYRPDFPPEPDLLARLGPAAREVYHLLKAGHSLTQIARLRGVSEAAAGRARLRIRQAIEAWRNENE